MSSRSRRVIATLLLVVACGGDSSGPTDVPAADGGGSVSFAYTGGGGGSYSASGLMVISASQSTDPTKTWALGTKSTNVVIVANLARSGGLADQAILTIGRLTAGGVTISPDCSPFNPSCSSMFFVIGQLAVGATGSSAEQLCTTTSGSISITSITSTRAIGTFSATGTCFRLSASTSSIFTATTGAFNVPITSLGAGAR